MVQPKNKKEECKVYVSINPKEDKTIKSDYVLLWDGECKNGYASGLGREIENTMLTNIQQIGFYEDGKAVDYCTTADIFNNKMIEGECPYSKDKSYHIVETVIEDKLSDININYTIGSSLSKNSPSKTMTASPFKAEVEYKEIYPNFQYNFIDNTNNEFSENQLSFIMYSSESNSNIPIGYLYLSQKNGIINAIETLNFKNRKVQLPQSYITGMHNVLFEIKQEVKKALEAQQKALIIKEKYKNKMCKDSVKVDFMDNSEYKAICNEDKKFAELKTKIDAKLAQIDQQKQAKRQQQNQQQLIQARQMEAVAAQRQAKAMENANNQAELDSLNRSMQNLNNSMQNNIQMLNQRTDSLRQQNNQYMNNSNSNEKNLYYIQQFTPNLYYIK